MSIFDVNRVRKIKDISYKGGCILYWMQRDKRVNDNWALLYAQELAQKHNTSLHVCFSLNGDFPKSNIRQYGFMLRGLENVVKKLKDKNISFSLIRGEATDSIVHFSKKHKIGFIVTDFSPLRVYRKRTNKVSNSVNIPFHVVDAHNIVPVWEASNKQEYAAYTIRPKLHKQLDTFLTDFPSVKYQKNSGDIKPIEINIDSIIKQLNIDRSVKEVDWILSGEDSALKSFNSFKDQYFLGYDIKRNDPNKNCLSNLSPYIHFGQISTQRIVIDVMKSDNLSDRDAFIEQIVVRKELAENFCYYNNDYDSFSGITDWAKNTLNDHRNDTREYIYNFDTFENGDTHDKLWNAAQNQMVSMGKMHGYLRMYWAKKILEWSVDPETALNIAIELNDKYELDGRDPRGYTGIVWSIGGIHDRPWFERPVFGKIRYMNYNGCKRKFDVSRYIEINKRS